MVGAQLDYCNSLYFGISEASVNKLQLIQNTLIHRRQTTSPRNTDPYSAALVTGPIPHRLQDNRLTLLDRIAAPTRCGLCYRLEVCGNDYLVPIPFPLPSNHSHSHPFPFPFRAATIYVDYLKAEKYVYCVVNSKQNMKVQQKHCNQTHQSSSLSL